MSAELIKEVLETGVCPSCKTKIVSDENMKNYICTYNRDHFDLQVTFHGGEKITASLNGEEIPEHILADIDW